jgi:hypothetical protein
MEGLSSAQSWITTTSRLKVPDLRTSPRRYLPPSASFYNFPQHRGYAWEDRSDFLYQNFPSISSLASFLQSWLFFQLLSAFLDHPVDCDDFVTDTFIDLDRKAVHDHFRLWKKNLGRLSHDRKRSTQLHIEAVIHFALSKSDVFEEAANLFGSEDEDFDRIALSVKVLISLLNSILDDTFSRSDFAVHDFEHGYLGDIMDYQYGQPRNFPPPPSGDSHGGHAALRLIRLLEDNG